MFEFIDASLSKVALANNGFRSSSRVLISTEFVRVIKPMSAVLPFAEVRIYDLPGVIALTGRLPFVPGRTACSFSCRIYHFNHFTSPPAAGRSCVVLRHVRGVAFSVCGGFS